MRRQVQGFSFRSRFDQEARLALKQRLLQLGERRAKGVSSNTKKKLQDIELTNRTRGLKAMISQRGLVEEAGSRRCGL